MTKVIRSVGTLNNKCKRFSYVISIESIYLLNVLTTEKLNLTYTTVKYKIRLIKNI